MTGHHGRRELLGLLGAAGVWALFGCSPGDGDGTRRTTTIPSPSPRPPGATPGTPTNETMRGWVEEIVAQGVRRPGYPADAWVEDWLLEVFRELGLDDVHAEPVTVTRWEPTHAALTVTPHAGVAFELACFPLPYGPPTGGRGIELDLVPFDPDTPEVAGRAALVDAELARVPSGAVAGFGSAPDDLTRRAHDPDGTFVGEEHVLPHTAQRNRILDPVAAAGAAAFVGALHGHPADEYRYFVPYHGEPGTLPGCWVSDSDGERLRAALAEGPVRIRLVVESTTAQVESRTIVGELPGADERLVLVGSHHDGPWASAVEDATGTALVVAQAAHWAALPDAERPHRLRFVVHAGHMCGGAGHRRYIAEHADDLERVVLAVHLEHAAHDPITDRPVPRWFFTTRHPDLEAAVFDAITAEDLRRSLLVAPDALGENPPTDGAQYHRLGVPIVQLLAAPWYLFDAGDTIDKVDVANLERITRTAARIVKATADRTTWT
jgi:hypothetical protein